MKGVARALKDAAAYKAQDAYEPGVGKKPTRQDLASNSTTLDDNANA